MQCLEVRRLLTVESAIDNPAVREHLASCQHCRSFSQRLLEFDADLEQAIDVDVPQGLAARILLNQSTEEVHQERRLRSSWLAIAASLFLVVGLAAYLIQDPALTPLQRDVLTHIHDELPHLNERNHVSPQQVEQLLSHYGAQLTAPIGQVNYAGACPISRHVGVHLVVEAGGKPVTVLVMPGERVASRHLLRDQRFQGVILPVGSQGSMAIIGEDTHSVSEIETRLRDALKLVS